MPGSTSGSGDDDNKMKSRAASSSTASSGYVTLTSLWTKLPTTSPKHKQISTAIAKYIALDMRPLDSINDRGFFNLVHTLEPRFNMESRTHITDTLLPKTFADLKQQVQYKVNKASFVSLTMDAWTGRNQKSFVTVTAQHIDSDLKMRSFFWLLGK